MITKSTGKMNFPTLTSTSSRIPYGCAIDLSAICNVISVGVMYFPIDAAADILVEDSVHVLGLVMPPLPYEKFSWFLSAGL